MDRSFLRHAATYGLSTFLIHASGLILLPIYLYSLMPREYAVLSLVNRIAETVGTFLLFGGFRQALFTFYQQAPDHLEQRRVVTSSYILVICGGLVGLITLIGFHPILASSFLSNPEMLPDSHLLLALAVISILIEPFSLLPLSLLQARVESIFYTIIVVLQFVFRISLGILLMRVFHWGVLGALAATTITGVIFGLVLTTREISKGLAWPRWAQLQSMLFFAIPLLPGGFCFFVLHNGDRFFLPHYSTLDEIGTYELGYKLAMTVRVFSLMPLYMVWSSHMYAAAARADASILFGRVTTRILSAVLFASLVMALFAPEVIYLFGRVEYQYARHIVGPILLVSFMQSASCLMEIGFFLKHRTGTKLTVTLASTVVVLVLYAVLIPPYGVIGAALATIGGFLCLLLGTYWISQSLFFVRYEWVRLGSLSAITLLLWALGHWLPLSLVGFVVKSALVTLAPLMAWYLQLITPEEKLVCTAFAARILATITGASPAVLSNSATVLPSVVAVPVATERSPRLRCSTSTPAK